MNKTYERGRLRAHGGGVVILKRDISGVNRSRQIID